MNILFVCTGNTCRSPMAEGYLNSKNIKGITAKSRGLAADGSGVSENSKLVMGEIGIDISEHISKQITLRDIGNADLIFCLSDSHRQMLEPYVEDKTKLKVLGNGIADPFGRSLEIYRECRDGIMKSIDKILPQISEGPYKICKAEREHIKQIAELERVCFSDAWSLETLLDAYKHGTRFYVCENKGQVLGYVGLNVVLDEGYITNVAVFPQYRRLGVATKILEEILVLAGKDSLSFISLEVRKSNFSAISLYEKLGFKIEGERKRFYQNPIEDAYIMTKRFEKDEDISD